MTPLPTAPVAALDRLEHLERVAAREAARRRGEPQPYDLRAMVTQARAERTAAHLFADEVADGSDCRAEIGREGLPCAVCAARNADWLARVASTRKAMLAAFA